MANGIEHITDQLVLARELIKQDGTNKELAMLAYLIEMALLEAYDVRAGVRRPLPVRAPK